MSLSQKLMEVHQTEKTVAWINKILDMGLEVQFDYGDDDPEDRITQKTENLTEVVGSQLYACCDCLICIWDGDDELGWVHMIPCNNEDIVSNWGGVTFGSGNYTNFWSSVEPFSYSFELKE